MTKHSVAEASPALTLPGIIMRNIQVDRYIEQQFGKPDWSNSFVKEVAQRGAGAQYALESSVYSIVLDKIIEMESGKKPWEKRE